MKQKYLSFSIITCSLNQGAYIERTIKSVLAQNYPDLEYIIVDGASTDNTLEILKSYQDRIIWISEPDRGQAHAINKGFNMSKGEIIGWINSDDLYLPDSFEKVNQFFIENQQVDMVYGDCYLIDENDKKIGELDVPVNFNLKRLIEWGDYIPQPSTFFRRHVFEQVGGINESLQYSMDYDLWIKIGLHFQVRKINTHLSCFRKHPQQKTFHANPDQYRENLRIRARYGGIKQKYQYVYHLIAEIVMKIVLKNEKVGKGT